MLPIPTLVLTGPGLPSRVSSQLRDELTWRGFDVVERALRDARRGDVSIYRLVILVFPAVPIPLLSGRPLGGVLRGVEEIQGWEGTSVALLAVSPYPTDRITDRVARAVRQRGGEVVVSDTVPPVGPSHAVVDLAAECMVRVI